MNFADELKALMPEGSAFEINALLAQLADFLRAKASQGRDLIVLEIEAFDLALEIKAWAEENGLSWGVFGNVLTGHSYTISWGVQPKTVMSGVRDAIVKVDGTLEFSE
jgi:hypothetical protein